jgi:hypothetical protein
MMRGRNGRKASDELAVLKEVTAIRERIRRSIGAATIDVLEAVERSRRAHS